MTARNRRGSLPRDVFIATVFVLAAASTAMAHPQQGQAQGFLTGAGHPVAGLDHLLAMICIGVWGAQLGQPAIWLLPVTFPMVMALGGFLGLVGIPLPGVEVAVSLSAVLLGVMVARAARPPLAMAAVLVGVFAIFHGHAHGTELPAGQSGLAYSIGFVTATGGLHGIGIAIGEVNRWPAGRVLLRAAGVAVAIVGVALTWSAL